VISDLPLHPQLLRAADELGFTEPTAVQADAIPAALTGRDLIVCSKTGSGKTAAFLLPTLNLMLDHDAPKSGTRVLILLPTRELALQTRRTFDAMARYTQIKCGLIMGGEAFNHQAATLRKNPEVIIATPGRLVEHIEKGTPDFRDLEVLVLDEADRMLDMGFAVDMETIARACRTQRQTLLFSATLSHKGMPGITRMLRDPESITIDEHRQGHDSITQQVVLADDVKHKEKLVIALLAKEQAPRSMIFCNTRKGCQELGNALKAQKLRVDYIHGELSQSDRKQVMNRFRSGQIGILVATDVAARGLDIEGITLVINFNVAQSGDDHVHRIGRTGRAGQVGKAITLVSSNEWNPMSSIERYLKLRFEHRKVPGLQARYRGPVKVKKSGKAAGSKKTKARRSQKKTAQPKKSGGEIGYKPLKR